MIRHAYEDAHYFDAAVAGPCCHQPRAWLAAAAVYPGRPAEAERHLGSLAVALPQTIGEAAVARAGGSLGWLSEALRFRDGEDLSQDEDGLSVRAWQPERHIPGGLT